MQHTKQYQLELGKSRVPATGACWTSGSHGVLLLRVFGWKISSRDDTLLESLSNVVKALVGSRSFFADYVQVNKLVMAK